MNTKVNVKLCWLLAIGVLMASASETRAQTYRFKDLGTGTAAAINNAGQVAGVYDPQLPGFLSAAVLWNGAVKTVLPNPVPGPDGFETSAAHGINDAGHVVGEDGEGRHEIFLPILWIDGIAMRLGEPPGGVYYASVRAINDLDQMAGFDRYIQGQRGATKATLWDRTVATDLGTLPGGNESRAYGINNAGLVAGWSDTFGGAVHATVWNGSRAVDLGTLPGGYESQAFALNDAGLVVGEASNHATVWSGGTATELGSLPGWNESSVALGINDAGLIVGAASNHFGSQHAVLWHGTTAIDLNTFLDADRVKEGWYLASANDINERGWIVGNAQNDRTRETHAFLLVPEPETYAMLLSGLGLIGFIARRKRRAS